jgi:hypothetical protein
MTARRPSIRSSDIKTTLAAFKEAGISPCAVDTLPGGAIRWHLTPLKASEEDDIDREIRENEARWSK